MAEGGPVAGWEVEVPVKTVWSSLGRRETLALTSLPSGLARVMGEQEYQEQVVAIRELTEEHNRRVRRLKVLYICWPVLALPFLFLGIFVVFTPLLLGLISEEASFVLTMAFLVLVAIFLSCTMLLFANGYYRVGLSAKILGYEISRATSHWGARGIAWKLMKSKPLAVTVGKDNRVAADYCLRVYVECAPDAIDLFAAHGPFPTSRTIPSREIEPYSDHESVTDADRGSKRVSGGPDGTPTFSLAVYDVFFSRIPYVVPKRPMMLKTVMDADEFAEQVAVINRDIDRLSKPWKTRLQLLIVSAAIFLPCVVFSLGLPFTWLVLGLSYWWISIVAAAAIASASIGFLIGSLAAVMGTGHSTERKMEAVLDKQSERWDSRGIEWFLSDEIYHLTVFGQTIGHIERRISVRVRPEAVDKYRTLGPFPPGDIDGAACVTYDLSSST